MTDQPTISPTGSSMADGDGQGAFDWEIGTWSTSVQVLADPLSGAPEQWLTFAGRSIVRALMGGRANIVELRVSGPGGQIDGLNLRLYQPETRRWSSTFASLRDGMLTPSVHGGFQHGVGEFYGDDELAGRPITVRFLIHCQGPDEARFEQAYSEDGGTSWETNWIAVDQRITDDS
jgi:hypothetical protein